MFFVFERFFDCQRCYGGVIKSVFDAVGENGVNKGCGVTDTVIVLAADIIGIIGIIRPELQLAFNKTCLFQ